MTEYVTGEIDVILDDPTTWPQHLMDCLRQREIVELLRRRKYVDQVVNHDRMRPVLAEIENYVAATPLAAYHCTRQLPERPYMATGLRTLNLAEHHAQFRELIRTHDLVTPAFFQKIDDGLGAWQSGHTGKRDNMLWLCIDRQLVFDNGTERFFKYFGGEAIYRAFTKDPAILQLLERLGEPVVVEVRVASSDLTVFQEFAFARTLVSHFAHSVNSAFEIEGREGYSSKGVGPDDIVAVYPHEQFLMKYRRQ